MFKFNFKFNFSSFVAGWLLVAFFAVLPVRAGEKLLFVSDLEERDNWDIYVIDLDDTSGPGGLPIPLRLTTDSAIDNHPEVSPDGTKVVWSSTRDPGTNPEGDFEIFVTDWIDPNSLETGTITQLSSNDYPDRHPHFNHNPGGDPNDVRIIYSAKYICVKTIETTCVSICSIPSCITEIDLCGRKCEGMRIMKCVDENGDNRGDDRIDIDHATLTAANAEIWPPRPDTDVRWVGHPSFAHDDSMIVFSGAVDGQGRNWEVYVLDWNGTAVSNLRQITLDSDYPANSNPIMMTGGAHFSEDDATILFTSTRTELGNSQLFVLPTTSDRVAVGPANRHPLDVDLGNVYVPEPLTGGRIAVTTDIDEFTGMLSCRVQCDPLTSPIVIMDPGVSHVIKIEATGMLSPSNPAPDANDLKIHLDAYELDMVLIEESSGTTSGSWSTKTSPNASGGSYRVNPGTVPGDYVEIAIPSGTSMATLYLGRTPRSGVARILLDGSPITDGDVTLPGDVDPNKSGVDLYTPDFTTSNDLDILIIDVDGTSTTNITDDDYADQMLLIGDEVSWFCGLKPNLSLCTYLPKSFTVGQLRLMDQSETALQDGFPNKCLYPIAFDALDQYMRLGEQCTHSADFDNDGDVDASDAQHLINCMDQPAAGQCADADLDCDGFITQLDMEILQCQFGGAPDPSCSPDPPQTLRPHNAGYWQNVLAMMNDTGSAFDDVLVVLPTPVNYCIDNEPPTEPNSPQMIITGNDTQLSASASTDPEGDDITYDIYVGLENGALLIVGSDLSNPTVVLNNLPYGNYSWRVVAKDCRGGLKYGPLWPFCASVSDSDYNCDFVINMSDYGFLSARWLAELGIVNLMDVANDWLLGTPP